MNNRHLIDTAVFDIAYDHGAIDFEQQSEIDSFIKSELLQVVDEVFDEVTRQGAIYRIGSLELDLGEIPYRDYSDDMPKRLREQLVSTLAEFRHAANSGRVSEGIVVEQGAAELEQLFYFLRNGYLPWYSRLSGNRALDGLLAQAIDTKPDKLEEFLDEVSLNRVVMERLVSQFDHSNLTRLTRLLGSSRSNSAKRFGAGLAQRFLTQNEQPDHVAAANELNSLLSSALRSGDFTDIRFVWPEMVSGHAQMLEKALRYYGQQAQTRKRIVVGFDDEILQDILLLLEPTEHAFVKSVIDHTELFRQEQAEPSESRPQRNEMWEFSLAYVLVERGSRFNKKSYLKSLLRQMAVSRVQSEPELLGSLRKGISTLPKGNPLAGQMLQLLSELSSEVGDEVAKQEVVDAAEFGVYQCYERIKRSFIHVASQPGSESVLIDDIALLKQNAPWLLLRLFRELQTDFSYAATSFAGCSASVLEQFALALISLKPGTDSMRQGDLLNAVEAHAASAAHRAAFFDYVLRCLINEASIDFDSVAGRGLLNERAAETYQNTVTSSPRLSHPDSEPLSRERAQQTVEAVLNGKQAISDEELIAFDRSLDLMWIQRPLVLRQMFELAINNETWLERCVSQLPESLLTKLLSLLGVTDSGRLLKCAELMTTACRAKALGIAPERLESLKWRFIYSYLADTGCLFNQHYFARQYAETLKGQADHADSHQFRRVLIQRLQQDMLPSVRDITQDLIRSLSDDDIGAALHAEADALPTSDAALDQFDEPAVIEEIYIANAGMILAAPYLPRLFDMLGLTENSAFINRDAAERGMHMLQFLVDERVSSPEYQLVLNKLLCGVKPGRPVRRGVDLADAEKQQLEGLLLGMMQHWNPLRNTSIKGLRESFLQRHGKLQLKNEAWHLSVEPKPFDMLLDQIPWSYSTIKFPWMDRVIYVEWR